MFYLTVHSTHFYLRLSGVGHIVKDHSDSERGREREREREREGGGGGGVLQWVI